MVYQYYLKIECPISQISLDYSFFFIFKLCNNIFRTFNYSKAQSLLLMENINTPIRIEVENGKYYI